MSATEQTARLRRPTRPGTARLGALALVLVAVATVTLVLAIGGEDKTPSPVEAAGPPETEAVLSVPAMGISVRYPEGWTADRKQGVVRLRRRDGTALVAVAPTGRASEADEVLAAAVDRTREEYERFRRLGSRQLELSGLPTRAETFIAGAPDGTPRRILLSTVEGDRRAYLVSAFTTPQVDLFEVEAILNSLSLR